MSAQRGGGLKRYLYDKLFTAGNILNTSVQLVWFKRDLRLHDHAPLLEASRRGPTLCLYVYEPSLIAAAEFDSAHQVFINASLKELRAGLRKLGGDLTLRVGEVPEVFDSLLREQPFGRIWAHEETGTFLSYERDRRVRRWAKARGVLFTEHPANGVVRRLKSRNGWAQRWQTRMGRTVTPLPEHLNSPDLRRGQVRSLRSLGLPANTKSLTPEGGERRAHEVLKAFLCKRGRFYRSEMSSPVTAFESSSRISPYLAWGNLSLRQVYQAALARYRDLKTGDATKSEHTKGWLRSLSSFLSRLRWHDHFIQKLEDQPTLEFQNANRGFDGLREDDFNGAYFEAWKAGQTGYPVVDACMRALRETGWLNFRMRAMVVSFASYHLWLHWRKTGLYLGRHWLDFEPGIHWPQMQMQSGVTGINTVRIYSPRKQVEDHDPDGLFVKRWVPELRDVPSPYLAEPHCMPPLVQGMANCHIGKDYPSPVVDSKTAYHEAKRRVAQAKFSPKVQALSNEVYERHGSRAAPVKRRGRW